MDRRTALSALGTAGLGALTGCLNLSPAGTNTKSTTTPETPGETKTTTTSRTPSVDWPSFQFDPQNTGYRSEIAGPTDGGSVIWEHVLAGAMRASPIVADGVVYGGSDSGDLVALDANDGAERWRTSVVSETHTNANVAVTYQPAFTNDLALFGGYDHGFVALDAETGDLEWRASGDTAQTVAGETVYTADNRLIRLAARTGEPIWDIHRDVNFSTPAVLDGTVYAGLTSGHALALDGETGAVDWSRQIENAPLTAPVATDDALYLGTQPVDSMRVGDAISTGGSGSVYAIDPSDGRPIWRASVPGNVNGAPASDGKRVYVGSDTLTAIDAASGTTVWSFDPGTFVHTAPVVTTEAVFCLASGHTNRLLCLDATTGEKHWEYEAIGLRANPAPRTSSPVVTETGVFFGSANGSIYRIGGK